MKRPIFLQYTPHLRISILVFLATMSLHGLLILPGAAQPLYIYNTRNANTLLGNFYYTLGTQMAARGQILTATDLLGKASALLPNNPYVHMNDGVVLEALEKYPEALTEYQKAARLDPTMAQAFYSMGLLYDKMDQLDNGIKTLHQALALDPGNRFMNYDLGVLYAKKEDFANSALYTKRALGDGPEFAEAYNNYGYALAQLGRYSEALVAIDKSLALKSDSAAALDSRGFALVGLGNYSEALDAYNKALKIDPTIGEVYLHQAQAYEKLHQPDKARKSYETYLQMVPNAPNRADIQAKLKQGKP